VSAPPLSADLAIQLVSSDVGVPLPQFDSGSKLFIFHSASIIV
jgi:hypothetical protein